MSGMLRYGPTSAVDNFPPSSPEGRGTLYLFDRIDAPGPAIGIVPPNPSEVRLKRP